MAEEVIERMNDYELLAKFLELTERRYSIEGALDYLTIEALGYDPEKYDIQPSDGYPWNGWLVDRETGFSEFKTGLWQKYIQTRAEITKKIHQLLWGCAILIDKIGYEQFRAEKEAEEIERVWKEVVV